MDSTLTEAAKAVATLDTLVRQGQILPVNKDVSTADEERTVAGFNFKNGSFVVRLVNIRQIHDGYSFSGLTVTPRRPVYARDINWLDSAVAKAIEMFGEGYVLSPERSNNHQYTLVKLLEKPSEKESFYSAIEINRTGKLSLFIFRNDAETGKNYIRPGEMTKGFIQKRLAASIELADFIKHEIYRQRVSDLDPKTRRRLSMIELSDALQDFSNDYDKPYREINVIAPYKMRLELRKVAINFVTNEPIYEVASIRAENILEPEYSGYAYDISVIGGISNLVNDLLAKCTGAAAKIVDAAVENDEPSILFMVGSDRDEKEGLATAGYSSSGYGQQFEDVAVPDYMPDNLDASSSSVQSSDGTFSNEQLFGGQLYGIANKKQYANLAVVGVTESDDSTAADQVEIKFTRRTSDGNNEEHNLAPALLSESQIKRLAASLMFAMDKVQGRYIVNPTQTTIDHINCIVQ